ncbi:hypothetical protein F5Y04DRAFT_262937 [Hypomontagnella monticulosa]|nr:hypothetical protein F5Y04DRAFT_262937 [Hypomontagnella monticulosa]
MKRIRFIGDHGDGSGAKRKQVRRACGPCRKGKRKCYHNESSAAAMPQGRDANEVAQPTDDSVRNPALDTSVNHRPQESVSSIETHEIHQENQEFASSLSTSRLTVPFTGASSAHALLLSACPEVDMDEARQLPPSRLLRPSFQDMRAPSSERRPGVAPGYLPMVVRAVLPYLEIEALQVLPPPQDLDALIRIYKHEIHPILSIVDFSTPALADPVSRENPATIVLRQAICLAACKNASARQHLNLLEGESGRFSFMTPRDFADRLFGALKITQDIGLVDDRVELVQVLALMTFHSYGPDGDDEVARLCGQAVHFAYSAGLHYPSRPDGLISEARRVELLCALYALDKIVAMVAGRPAMVRSNEIYLPQEDDVLKTLAPGFALLFRLSQMLDRALDLYGAGPLHEMEREECIWDTSWPEFEDLVKEYVIQTIPPSLQTCLELLYHVIAVISYRPPQTLAVERPEPESASLPVIQSSKIRHKYSAQQISFLLSQEVSKFPFIPYAASLSLTAALRNMQQATLESTRKIAERDVERSLGLLEKLAETYWHAESVGRVGRQLYQTVHNEDI